jgi:hypothetical protein
MSSTDEELRELARSLSILSDLRVDVWKREVIAKCVKNPDCQSIITLVFKNCQEISYQAFEEEFWQENIAGIVEGADIIGLIFEVKENWKILFLTTDLFEIKVVYTEISVLSTEE